MNQTCSAGACFSPTGMGGGAGGGTGGDGIGGGGHLEVMPFGDDADPVVVEPGADVEFIARAVELSSPNVSFSLVDVVSPSPGHLVITGPQTARFVSHFSHFTTAHVQVTSEAWSSYSQTVTLVATGTKRLRVAPTEYSVMSRVGYVLSTNTRQTFALVDRLFSTQNARGTANVAWYLWTNEASNFVDMSVDGTALFRDPGTARVFARDFDSKQWASTDIIVEATPEASVEITPAVSTVSVGGVVQLTAMVSTGAAVSWQLLAANTGSISSTGTYTAPTTPGVYVVKAVPSGGDGLHYAVATIIVQ